MIKTTLLILLHILFTSFISDRWYNQVELSRNNTITNYTQMKFLDTVVSVALDHEGIKDKMVIINPLSDEAKDNFSGDLRAMLVYRNSAFYIFVDEQTHHEALTIISHEVVHMNQYLNNDLVVEGEQVSWKGEKWNLDNIPYEFRPWEVEAFEKQSNIEDVVSSELMSDVN